MDQNPEVPQKPEEIPAEESQPSADTWLPVEQEAATPPAIVEAGEVVAAEMVETGEQLEEGASTVEEVVYETTRIGESSMVSEAPPGAEIPPPSPAYEESTFEKPLQPEILGTSGSTLPPKKSNNGWVIALIILLLLCCCCVAFIWFGVFFARVLGGVFAWVYELVISILNSIFGGVIQFY